MIMYRDRKYGADTDGNRGVDMTFYDLEDSDESEIIRQIKEQLVGYDEDDYPTSVVVTLICPITEDDIDFEVDVKDFI